MYVRRVVRACDTCHWTHIDFCPTAPDIQKRHQCFSMSPLPWKTPNKNTLQHIHSTQANADSANNKQGQRYWVESGVCCLLTPSGNHFGPDVKPMHDTVIRPLSFGTKLRESSGGFEHRTTMVLAFDSHCVIRSTRTYFCDTASSGAQHTKQQNQ